MRMAPYDPARRRFLLTGATAAGALVVGYGYSELRERVDRAHVVPVRHGEVALNAWLKIDVRGVCTVMVPRAEMGQGISTSLPMLVAEELQANWRDIRIEPAPLASVYANVAVVQDSLPVGPQADRGPGVTPVLVRLARAALGIGARLVAVQVTGGSTSIRDAWEPMRTAGAAARIMLTQVAAERWNLLPSQLVVEDGVVRFPPEGREAPFGGLVAAAARLPVPTAVQLKSPAAFTVIGTSPQRLDTPANSTGMTRFGIDARPPGMLHAALRRVPAFGARLQDVDEASLRARRGVRDVVRFDDGVAVVAQNYWQASAALASVTLQPVPGTGTQLSTAEVDGALRAALAGGEPYCYEDAGDAEAQLRAAEGKANTISAEYAVPYLAHACMEPMNCTVRVDADRCEVWVGHQSPSMVMHAVTRMLGLPASAVTLHMAPLGTGFGRRAEVDMVRYAVAVARQVRGVPVQLTWSREEDMRHDVYRPAAHARLRAVLDDSGRPLALVARVASASIARQFMSRLLQTPAMDTPERTDAEGVAWRPYAIPHRLVEHVPVDLPVPVGFWRSVGYSSNSFFYESFLDELAHHARRDPFEFRRRLLPDRPRYRAVLERAAAGVGWQRGGALAHGHGLGIALVESYGAIVAQAVRLRVDAGKQITIEQIACAVDVGIAVHPEQLGAQMRGAIVFGLSAALFGRIDFAAGAAVQSNYHDYPVLRMQQMPPIEVEIIDGGLVDGGVPGGGGEAGTPPIAPALANAIFAATGERVRHLPLRVAGYTLASSKQRRELPR